MHSHPGDRARRHPIAPVRPAGDRTVWGKRIHPAWVVPRGQRAAQPRSGDDCRDDPDALAIVERALPMFKRISIGSRRGPDLRQFPLRCSSGWWTWTAASSITMVSFGLVDADGLTVERAIPTERYPDHIGETVEPWSYLKSPTTPPRGYPDGLYRRAARPPQRGDERGHAKGLPRAGRISPARSGRRAEPRSTTSTTPG